MYFQSSLEAIFHFSDISDQGWWQFVNSLNEKDQRISEAFIDFKNALNRKKMTSLIFEVDEQKLPDAAWARLVRNTSPDDIEDAQRGKFIQIQNLISSGIINRDISRAELDSNTPATSASKLKTFRDNELFDGLDNLYQEIELTGQLAEKVKEIFELSAKTWYSLLEAEKLQKNPSNENVEGLKSFLAKLWGNKFEYILHPESRWDMLRTIKDELISSHRCDIVYNLMRFGKLHLIGNYELVSYSSKQQKKQLNLRWKQDREEKRFTSVLKECCLTCNNFRCRRTLVDKEYISYESEFGLCDDSVKKIDDSCPKSYIRGYRRYEQWFELK